MTDSSKEFIYFLSGEIKSDTEELVYLDLNENSIRKCGTKGINYFDISSDSTYLFYNRINGDGTNLKLFSYVAGSAEQIIDTLGFTVRVSPDNKRIAYRSINDVILANIKGGGKEVLLKGEEVKGHRVYFKSPAWSNNGEFIYFTKIEISSIADTTDIFDVSIKRISVKTKLIEDIIPLEGARTIRANPYKSDEIYAYEQVKNSSGYHSNIVRIKKTAEGKWTKELILNDGGDIFDVSPNGKSIVFMRDSVINDSVRYAWHLFIYDIENKKTKQVTFGSQSCDWPVWKKFSD